MKTWKKRFCMLSLLALCLFLAPPVQAATIKLSAKKITIVKGQKKKLTLKNAKGSVKWSTSKKKVATVDKKGNVTGKKKGTAVISATFKKKTYKCTVKVEEPKISKSRLTLEAGKTASLKVTGTTLKVSWKSSNKKIATVTSKGKVTAVKAGTCTITATVGGKKLKCTLTVKAEEKFKTFKETDADQNISKKVYETNGKIIVLLKSSYPIPVFATAHYTFYDADGKEVKTLTYTCSLLEEGRMGMLYALDPGYASYKISYSYSLCDYISLTKDMVFTHHRVKTDDRDFIRIKLSNYSNHVCRQSMFIVIYKDSQGNVLDIANTTGPGGLQVGKTDDRELNAPDGIDYSDYEIYLSYAYYDPAFY